MKTSITPTLLLIACVLCASAASAQMKPEMAAGFKAGFVCSGVFLAGRTLEQIMADELGGLPEVAALPEAEVDREAGTVSCTYDPALPPRIARHVKGLGTVILPVGATLNTAPALPVFTMPQLHAEPVPLPWPDGDLLPDSPLPVEVNAEALRTAVDRAFDLEAYPRTKTIGVAVVYKDRLVAEQYAEGWTREMQYRTWSTAKSMANAVVGIAVQKGLLTTSEPAPIPEWQSEGDPRKAITIEHLLEMSSGLKSPGALTYAAYWGGIDSAADAAAGEPRHEPGTRWMYANYDTLLLMKSIRHRMNDDAAYITLPRRELFDKIGMRHTYAETDPYGNLVLSSQVYTTPRDLARFGMLYLHDGVWNGERILPEGWVKYSTTPAKAFEVRESSTRGYGKQWWLLSPNKALPPDAYTTAGNRGQYCTVIPSRNLVVVRMGIDPMWQDHWKHEQFLAEVLAAIVE